MAVETKYRGVPLPEVDLKNEDFWQDFRPMCTHASATKTFADPTSRWWLRRLVEDLQRRYIMRRFGYKVMCTFFEEYEHHIPFGLKEVAAHNPTTRREAYLVCLKTLSGKGESLLRLSRSIGNPADSPGRG